MKNYNKKLFYRFLAGIAVVNVKTQDEYDQFMRALEKETILKWALGHKPTHFHGWTLNKEKTCVRCVTDNETILSGSTSYYESKGYEIIDFSDLIKKENNMKFKVGDKVKVKNWEDMKNEFGTDDDGDIVIGKEKGKTYFLTPWSKFYGTTQIISEVHDGGYLLESDNLWEFNDRMLEPVIKKSPKKKNSVLDKVERAYLSNIVAPQGIYKKVSHIVKHEVGGYAYKFYFIEIELEDDVYNDNNDNINLPSFPAKAHMYEGMVPEKPYTLAQLGIKRKEK